MCGICGYITTNPKEAVNAKHAMAKLLLYSQKRGDDASGIAFIHKEKIVCVKNGVPASKLIGSKAYLEAIKKYNPTIMIGHTRAKTQGDQKDNNNNHPILGDSLALVHNGVLYNEEDLFKEYKLERKGEVDSEVIVRLIEHYKKTKSQVTRVAIQTACKEIHGNMALGIINAKNDRELHLVCSGNPVVLAYQKSTGTVFFSSEKDILKDALYDYTSFLNFFYTSNNKDDYVFRELSAEDGLRLTAEKISQYKVERYVYSYNQTSWHNGEHWDATQGKYVKDTPIVTKQQKLLPEETKAKKEKRYVDKYDKRDCIKQPSLYCTDDLVDRMELLENIPFTKRTMNEENELKRIVNALTFRTKHGDYPTSHDYKLAIVRPEFYTLDQIEERIDTLEELQENGSVKPGELDEYEMLYNYAVERGGDEPGLKAEEVKEESLADEIEKKYAEEADKQASAQTKPAKDDKKKGEPTTADMQAVSEAENEVMYVDHRDEMHGRKLQHYNDMETEENPYYD